MSIEAVKQRTRTLGTGNDWRSLQTKESSRSRQQISWVSRTITRERFPTREKVWLASGRPNDPCVWRLPITLFACVESHHPAHESPALVVGRNISISLTIRVLSV